MFCEKYMVEYLVNNEEYKCKNYQKALEEVFVELDYLLVNEEGHEKMKVGLEWQDHRTTRLRWTLWLPFGYK